MINRAFIESQLEAKPFSPFTIIMDNGQRHFVRTADHVDIPPEQNTLPNATNIWILVYGPRSVPHVLACEHIASVDMDPDEVRQRAAKMADQRRRLKEMGYESPGDEKR